MKLKNSYLLLIAISLFLLVSVGSVCASEDNATDITTQVDNEGLDVLAVENDGTILEDGEGDGADNPEPMNTTVYAQDTEIPKGTETKIIMVVQGNDTQTLDVHPDELTVLEGDKELQFIYNNPELIIVDELTVGKHNITINFLGNALYGNSSKTITLSIFGNKTLDAPSTVTTDGNTVEIPLIVSDGVREYIVDMSKLTLNLTCIDEYGNATSEIITVFDIENNTVRFSLNRQFVSAYVNVSYSAGPTSSKRVALKYATQVNANDVRYNESDNKTISISVLSGENVLNITAADLKVIENGKELQFTYNNSIITISSLSAGNHTITIKYLGNDTYGESNKTVTASVVGNITINVQTPVNVNSTKKTNVTIINITDGVHLFDFDTDNIRFEINYKNGNETVPVNFNIINFVNGTFTLELENLNFTTATLTVTYNDTVSKNVTLNRIYNARIVVVNNENEYKTGNFTFKVVDTDNEDAPISGVKLSLYTTGNIRAGFSTTTNSEGIAIFKTANLYVFDNVNNTLSMHELRVGNYTVELSTDSNVKSTKVTTNLTITKATINIKIDAFTEPYQTKKNVTITVTNSLGEPMPGIIIHLYMPKTTAKDYYFGTDSNGKSKISVTNLIPGTYSLTVSNNDTVNINEKSVNGTITIKKVGVKIIAKDSAVKFNTGVTSIIKIVNAKTGKPVPNAIIKVKLYTTSTKYNILRFQADSKGVVRFSASLAVGKHKMVVGMAEENYEPRYAASSVTKYITVTKATAKIIAPAVTAYYKDGKYFTVKLVNPAKNNQPIYDAKLTIKIFAPTRYYTYTGNTGGNGQIKLSIDLAPGTYRVEVTGADSKNFACSKVDSKITVLKSPTKLTLTTVVAKKGSNGYFKAKMTNTKTKNVVKGVQLTIKVYTGSSYKTYTVRTGADGIAKLPIKSIDVGLHKVVVTSANKYCVATAATSSIKITK